LERKIQQMSGEGSLLKDGLKPLVAYNTRPIPAGGNPRLGIPGILFSDGPRGVVMYHTTYFPVSVARGASWDVDLEESIVKEGWGFRGIEQGVGAGSGAKADGAAQSRTGPWRDPARHIRLACSTPGLLRRCPEGPKGGADGISSAYGTIFSEF
jgi:hypothetical protein